MTESLSITVTTNQGLLTHPLSSSCNNVQYNGDTLCIAYRHLALRVKYTLSVGEAKLGVGEVKLGLG